MTTKCAGLFVEFVPVPLIRIPCMLGWPRAVEKSGLATYGRTINRCMRGSLWWDVEAV